MSPLHRMLLALIAAAPLSACLAPSDTEAVAVAVEALQPFEPQIPWPSSAQRFAAPPPVLEPEPEPSAAAETRRPPAPARPAPMPMPMSAGAVLFTQLAACRREALEMGGPMANARAMLCLAGVLRSASSL